MRKKTYFVAKVNIHGNILSPNLMDLINIHLPRAILEVPVLKKTKWNWGFTDLKRETIEGRDIIHGHITKSKKENLLVRKEGQTVKMNLGEELAKTAFFVYDVKSEILVHTTTTEIPRDKFKEVFEALVSQDLYVGEIKVKHIAEPSHVRSELLSVDKATFIKFSLIHPNPYKGEEFNLYQQIIKDTQTKEADLSLKNNSGFKLTQENSTQLKDTIEDGVRLVESGYGDVTLRGYNEVQKKNKKGKTVIHKDIKRFSSASAVRKTKSKAQGKDLIKVLTSFIIRTINKKEDYS
ncbi:hypothetical protein CHH78_02265 [Shouchella clausii]|uniref:hypothetical protein n=1 Tax=Shouchella clausii TaxID=79880 RepID=UPI000BA55F1C|nr:hypothetical protein [Shouchella clausii]PAD10160.1 hypothetical protein CHH76_05455 [Shouchella clausii]PAE84940.1 hypothetical protein CHH77_02145 [Shouchella clausii]PAE86142.1 hypothetical protein CHH78_02265 [Shouchella clausii]PAF06824.1 hypothetical protein CHH66_02260 [Shouchella clausii]